MTYLQETILDVFKEFKRVCEEYNLRYYAIGGTCLGAIRHKGFIPWDDDLDVAMPLEDYQRLRREWRNMLSEPYQLFDYETAQHCEFHFLKMFNGNTTYIEQHIKNMPDRYTGVFIDIMPIAGWPEEIYAASVLQQKIIWYRRFDRCVRFGAGDNESFKSKAFRILSAPLWKGKPFAYYSLKAEEEIGRKGFGTTKNILFPWRAIGRNIFPFVWFEREILVPFEDTTIAIPLGYDRYLKKDFGDYMQLPPIKDRQGVHPAEIIDYKKSYREYQEEIK